MEEQSQVEILLEEMRKNNGKIVAHPYMYVSALHNKSAFYPVDTEDTFFKENNIEVLDLANGDEPEESNENTMKYVVSLDEAGNYRHVIAKK
ncbi:hypothetical protein TVAG_240740 [Trichomonas vaginalis G3]|uniref:Uncharacterized protein n=1 Tax=Trichomonas vaginalis (strain ATCC PRA-98 / G3) TaxID=412133 RepID=A2EJC1_TRIV3|nr:hypothetical protein TVAGG3_0742100 [Trichomonas vaginalis G3]EAY07273.1 hypothetical protein TVAG_240740 [Trichomonas vaginalis G3]KAI5511955.1 hypothetical protein TVAGG3_0742100 [Trichomonas vaginalis G3]|eukprot:XP_001319496.1 hypothetical protein [Trichomonas vaginalis G3]